LSDVAVFLGSRPPFDAVGTDDLAHVAAMTETEAVPRGKTIFSQGAGPVDYLWVVRAAEDTVCYGSQNTPGRAHTRKSHPSAEPVSRGDRNPPASTVP
jgi:hypothetical protein